jgi:hypothetical protein
VGRTVQLDTAECLRWRKEARNFANATSLITAKQNAAGMAFEHSGNWTFRCPLSL